MSIPAPDPTVDDDGIGTVQDAHALEDAETDGR